MNIFKLIEKCACGLFIGILASCTQEEGPSIDDFFLNYEIPVIKPDRDISVGAFYYNAGGNGMQEERYNRLIGERDLGASPYPQLCPHVRPVLGRYKMNISLAETTDLFQQHIDWAQEAGINFFIMPNVGEDAKAEDHLNAGNVNFIEYMAGKNVNSENKINWGGMKYCISMDFNNFLNNSGISSSKQIEDIEVIDGKPQRMERIYTYFKNLSMRFFMNNDFYYEVDGKPVVVCYSLQKLYSKDAKRLYDNIRDTVYKYSNKEIYIVARQDQWTPPARFYYFFLSGHADAVFMNRMYEQNDMARSYMYPQYINENWKYNREYDWANHQIDFIPNISPSYNRWLGSDGTKEYQYPFVDKDEVLFRKMCNVAKMNLGKKAIVFIDSFNYWDYDMALEPADPAYGNGYGMKYLNIVRDEFKR